MYFMGFYRVNLFSVVLFFLFFFSFLFFGALVDFEFATIVLVSAGDFAVVFAGLGVLAFVVAIVVVVDVVVDVVVVVVVVVVLVVVVVVTFFFEKRSTFWNKIC